MILFLNFDVFMHILHIELNDKGFFWNLLYCTAFCRLRQHYSGFRFQDSGFRMDQKKRIKHLKHIKLFLNEHAPTAI